MNQTVSPEAAAAERAGEGARVARGATVLAGATMLSRITGFVRDAAILAVFGAAGGDLWFLAWRLPNVMRRLVAEGSLTVSFVPLFTNQLENQGRSAAHQFTNRAFTLAALALATMVALAVWQMPHIVGALASTWRTAPEKFASTVELARWAFPYLLMVGLVALSMGVLNSLRRFFIPAVSSVLLNLTLCAGALVFSTWAEPPIMGLGWAAVLGGVAQLTLVLGAMGRAGFFPRLDFRFRDPGLKRLLVLMGPATFGASVHQLNLLLSTAFATSVSDGAVAWLYSADRLIELPLGVVAVSIAVATLPSLSASTARGDMSAYKSTLLSSLRQLLFLVLPAAAGLMVLAVPIMSTVFQRGEFNHADSLASANALVLYALGLPFVAGSRVVIQGFYALEDTKTPVAVGALSVLTFASMALALMPGMGHRGIAVASSAAAAVNLSVNLALLRRKVGPLGLRRLVGLVGRCALGLVGLVGAAYLTAQSGDWRAGATGLSWATARNVAALGAAVAAGAGAYAALTLAAGLPEATATWQRLRRRLGR